MKDNSEWTGGLGGGGVLMVWCCGRGGFGDAITGGGDGSDIIWLILTTRSTHFIWLYGKGPLR